MTPAQLRASLAALLDGHLGTYTTEEGTSMGAAIRVGEPPSDWTASGVEVRIEPGPEYDNKPLHQHTAIAREFRVRIIPRSGSGQTVVERICQRFDATSPTVIPTNERLGISQQYTLLIRA